MEHLNEIAAAFRQASIPCAAREPLSRHTSFQIGGPAALFCEPQNKRQLARAIAVCRQAGVRYYLLGKGTNILFADEGFDGVVIHIGEMLGNIECNGLSVTAQAGAALAKVCIAAANEGLSGLEFAYGIPGCVGGAVYMNAGAYGGEIKDVLACATFLDETGAERTLQAGELQLGYRTSVFRARALVHPVRDIYAAGRRHRPRSGSGWRITPPPHGETSRWICPGAGQHVQAPGGSHMPERSLTSAGCGDTPSAARR